MTDHGFDYIDRRPEHVTRDDVVRAWQALDSLVDKLDLETMAEEDRDLAVSLLHRLKIVLPDRPEFTMAELDWDEDLHPLAEAKTTTGDKHVMVLPFTDPSTGEESIVTTSGVFIKRLLTPTGRRYRLVLDTPEESAQRCRRTKELAEIEDKGAQTVRQRVLQMVALQFPSGRETMTREKVMSLVDEMAGYHLLADDRPDPHDEDDITWSWLVGDLVVSAARDYTVSVIDGDREITMNPSSARKVTRALKAAAFYAEEYAD